MNEPTSIFFKNFVFFLLNFLRNLLKIVQNFKLFASSSLNSKLILINFNLSQFFFSSSQSLFSLISYLFSLIYYIKVLRSVWHSVWLCLIAWLSGWIIFLLILMPLNCCYESSARWWWSVTAWGVKMYHVNKLEIFLFFLSIEVIFCGLPFSLFTKTCCCVCLEGIWGSLFYDFYVKFKKSDGVMWKRMQSWWSENDLS